MTKHVEEEQGREPQILPIYEIKIGYMCAVDYEYHIEHDPYGATVYPTIEDLKNKRSCVDECGIVEVEVRVRRFIHETKAEETLQ